VHGRGADEDEANGVRTSAPCRVVRLHARPGQRRGKRLGVIHWARVSRSLISAIGSELYKQCVSSNAYQDSSQKIKNAYQDTRADGRHQDNYKTAESCSTASV